MQIWQLFIILRQPVANSIKCVNFVNQVFFILTPGNLLMNIKIEQNLLKNILKKLKEKKLQNLMTFFGYLSLSNLEKLIIILKNLKTERDLP